MKSRLIGLVFAFVVCCLMCLPFIVSSEPAEEPPAAQCAAVREDAILTAPVRVAPAQEAVRRSDERLAALPAVRAVRPPVSDANGLPILRTSYIRSNYQAFSLTGNGG